jgi:hypothetical protein
MITGIKELVDAELAGKERRYTWRKTPSQATTAGLWFDLSMSPGRPVPKYWFDAPPAIAKQITYSADGGLEHGGGVYPSEKYLRLTTSIATAVTALPLTMILCDYLLYYPSIDDSILEEQIMDNSVSLPRYTDGEGVQVIAVSVAGRTGGASFYFTYTNSKGVSGRTSKTVFQNSAEALGTLQANAGANNNAAANPFIGLQAGDTGVRSIDSVVMLSADVGLMTLILVKPLGTSVIREITAPVEKDYFLEAGVIPRIYDDAYLSFLCLPQGTLAATALMGDIKTIWTN